MKQWITEEQFNELTDSQKEKWYQWIKDHHYTFKEVYPYMGEQFNVYLALNFPSIGEMIEFLDKKCTGDLDFEIRGNNVGWSIHVGLTDKKRLAYREELCDALWEAVKEVI